MYILILFAASMSLDAAAVGFSYGMKKIRLPFASLVMLFVISSLMSAAGTFFGSAASQFMNEDASRYVSFVLLFGLGIWMIIDSFSERGKETPCERCEEKTFEFMVKSMGLSVKIIKHPIDCDFDKSSVIDLFEAVYLAFVLSVDSVCSCLGFGLGTDASYIMPILMGAFQSAFLYVGDLIGKSFAHIKNFTSRAAMLMPGAILIVVAVLSFFWHM